MRRRMRILVMEEVRGWGWEGERNLDGFAWSLSEELGSSFWRLSF